MNEALVACPECDLLHHRHALAVGEKALCTRCGGTLYHHPRRRPDQMLALVTGALLVFLIANFFPIVDLLIQGNRNSATLFGSILALWSEGRELVALLVFGTTMLFPLLDLAAMLVLLLAVVRGGRPAFFGPLLRFLQALRPWGMIEVLMLGVVVALVKLSNMAEIIPGAALWAFGALTILLAEVISYDLRALWDTPQAEAAETSC